MSAVMLDGKKTAEEIKEELISEIENLKKGGVTPGLAVILVGNDPASEIYVKNKEKMAKELGMYSEVIRLEKDTEEKKLLDVIEEMNNDEKIHGILVQLPLPGQIDEKKVVSFISPEKDVDCFHMQNVGKITAGFGDFLPCTPAGIMELIKRNNIAIEGKECVVVGRSNIVGKPMALMLLRGNGTVTMCHSKTRDLSSACKRADVIVSAVGKANTIKAGMIKPGAVVIDVGMNRTAEGKLVGDVDFDSVKEIAGAITPVPGGVGPMTIIMLMRNTILAAKKHINTRK